MDRVSVGSGDSDDPDEAVVGEAERREIVRDWEGAGARGKGQRGRERERAVRHCTTAFYSFSSCVSPTRPRGGQRGAVRRVATWWVQDGEQEKVVIAAV